MPGYVVHLEVARACLETLDGGPWQGWGDDPAVRNAFYHGALDPDMGYFPGGDRMVTDLSHYLSSGVLARTLFETASTEVERAYALGWVTHLIADSGLHPSVNRAAGEHLHGTADRPMTWADSPATHMRVEFGLDLARLATPDPMRRVRVDDVFDPGAVGLLVDAFETTYGLTLDGGRLLRAHRVVTWAQRLLFLLGTTLGSEEGPRRVSELAVYAAYHTTRLLSRPFPASAAYAFTHGLDPQPWLVADVDEALGALATRFRELVDGGLAGLADANLDTGEVDEAAEAYPMTGKTREALRRRLAGQGG